MVPALAALFVVAWWCRRRLGAWAALIATVLLVTSPVHLDLARQARGYGLAFLAQALLLVTGDRTAREATPRRWTAFGGSALIGIWTLPVFVLSFLGEAASLAWARARRRAVVVVVLVVGVGSIAFYGQVLGDLRASSSQKFGQQLPWYGLVSGPLDDLAGPTGRLLVHPDASSETAAVADRSPVVRVSRVLLAALAVGGAVALWRRRERDLALLLGAPIVATYGVLTAARVYVEPRFGSFLVVPFMVLVAVGAVSVASALPRPRSWWPAAGALTVAWALVSVRLIQRTTYENRYPIENFKAAAALVHRTGVRSVITNDSRGEGLPYYLGDVHEHILTTGELIQSFCRAPAPLVYVDDPFATTEPSTDCLVRRGAHMMRVHQRERGGRIDVWVLPRGA